MCVQMLSKIRLPGSCSQPSYHWIHLCKWHTCPKNRKRIIQSLNNVSKTMRVSSVQYNAAPTVVHRDCSYWRSTTDLDNSHIADDDWGNEIPICNTISCFILVSRLSIFTVYQIRAELWDVNIAGTLQIFILFFF